MRRLTSFPMGIAIPLLLIVSAMAWAAYYLHYQSAVEDDEVEQRMRQRLIAKITDLQIDIERILHSDDIIEATLGVQRKILPLGAERDLRAALLTDERNIILFATHEPWVGSQARRVLPDLNMGSMIRARDEKTGLVELATDRSSIMAYYPIIGAETGAEESAPISILFLQYDLTAQRAAARDRLDLRVGKVSLFLLSLAALIGLFFHFTLTRRVERLVAATERLAQGGSHVESGLSGRDELSRVGRAFDRMARKIQEDQAIIHQKTLLLEYQALHDDLTGLPNRVLFDDRLQQAILSAGNEAQAFGLFALDLDRFKAVNDSLGHYAGDLLLQQVAARMRATLRESETLARLGGDEFTFLLPTVQNAEQALEVAQKIVKALARAFLIEGHALTINASIGIVLFPQHGKDDITLMRRADLAMYHAKRAQAGCRVYDAQLEQSIATPSSFHDVNRPAEIEHSSPLDRSSEPPVTTPGSVAV